MNINVINNLIFATETSQRLTATEHRHDCDQNRIIAMPMVPSTTSGCLQGTGDLTSRKQSVRKMYGIEKCSQGYALVNVTRNYDSY